MNFLARRLLIGNEPVLKSFIRGLKPKAKRTDKGKEPEFAKSIDDVLESKSLE